MQELKIKNLAVSFHTDTHSTIVVKQIDIQVRAGEIVGLVGESGSGKSVTSLAIMRLLDRNASIKGCILFDEIDLLTLPEKTMQSYRGNRIAMIFQEPMTSLNPVLRCGPQVMESILLHEKVDKSQAREKVLALFEEVKLPDPTEIFNKYPHELSGGQKQRVMIAMALACNPDVLIADEPTTALDVTVQKSILQLLLKLRAERGMSLIFISHDLAVIGEIADRVFVMYQGEIVEHGKMEDVFLRPQHPYTKGLLACRPSPELQLRKMPIMSDFLVLKNKELTATSISIADLQKKYKITPEDVNKRRKELYEQTPILRVQSLSTSFIKDANFFWQTPRVKKAVDNISFEVYPGETFGLVGESGCGKTTLSRSILKLITPSAGKVLFENKDISTLKPSEMQNLRKDMQIIFQDPYSSLNPTKTVGFALTEPLRVHNVLQNQRQRKDYVIDLLEKVGLNAEHFKRYPHEFSGGQRQRIVIARALALQPKLIICDEPVSALDVSVQAQVLNLLKSLQTEFNLTYIFISHDMGVVKHMSDRIMVMNQGKSEEIDYPENLYHKPKTPYTQRLIEAIPKGIFAAKSIS